MTFGGGAVCSVNSCKAYIDVSLLSETHLKPHERVFIPNYHFYWNDRFPKKKGIPHNHVDLYYMFVTSERRSLFIRDKLILSSEKILHRDYECKGPVEKNIWSWLSRGWRQDGVIGGKPPVV
jgi:hypothetical protein